MAEDDLVLLLRPPSVEDATRYHDEVEPSTSTRNAMMEMYVYEISITPTISRKHVLRRRHAPAAHPRRR